MIDIEKLFNQISDRKALAKMKVDNCPIGVYYGYSETGNCRLAFLTENPPIVIESTANLKISQWVEAIHVYWTSFELLTESAKQVYFVLCNNLIKSAIGCQSEEIAMIAIKNRFTTWKKLFKKASVNMTAELYKGLFGELYFLKNWMMQHYDPNIAINAWSGSNRTAKDFSIANDWFEVKTISTNAETVKISSLTQLASDYPGKLILISTEQMSDEFDNGECSVEQLINTITNAIKDEAIKDTFIEKIIEYGYNIESANFISQKYRVTKMSFYCVDSIFPKITENEVPYIEIVRVTYELSIKSIEKYLEDEK